MRDVFVRDRRMRMHIVCKPQPEPSCGSVAYIDVSVEVDRGERRLAAGEILAEMTETIVGVPCCRMEGMTVRFPGSSRESAQGRASGGSRAESAAQGLPEWEEVRQEASPHIHTVRFLAKKAAEGAYAYGYRVYPRQVGPEGHSAPLFDFRQEPGGVNGAGVAFLALPPFSQAQVRIDWDLSAMPEGSEAVCAYFEGSGELTASREELLYSYYACGALKKEACRDFGMYWFGEPPFDAAEAAGRLKRLFAYMKDFFGEAEEKPYRIFVRRDPFDDSGHGTAGQRSFLFGYSKAMAPTVDSLMDLLAHEMVHNWPTMRDEPAGTGTWYVEGCAEYYSVVLPLRAGITDGKHTEKALNRRADPYFGNPYRFMPNLELGKHYWEDSAAQRAPYGRGFFYLARTDARIRAVSGGKRSLDSLVLALCHSPAERQTEEEYRRLLKQELGEDGVREFDKMRQGTLMIPDRELFDGAFDILEETGPDDRGEGVCTRYRFRLREG